MKEVLTLPLLLEAARHFCQNHWTVAQPTLWGVTDGKAIGTFVEQNFQQYLQTRYDVKLGSSSMGIDLPMLGIDTDIKVTSLRQPQSSSPFKNVRQKIFGLGYIVYDKIDDPHSRTAHLHFVHCAFVEKERTGDYTTTYRLRQMVADQANETDIVAYLQDRNLPADDLTLGKLAAEVLAHPLTQGYLTISNALQWRLQYQRIIQIEDAVEGIHQIITPQKPLL